MYMRICVWAKSLEKQSPKIHVIVYQGCMCLAYLDKSEWIRYQTLVWRNWAENVLCEVDGNTNFDWNTKIPSHVLIHAAVSALRNWTQYIRIISASKLWICCLFFIGSFFKFFQIYFVFSVERRHVWIRVTSMWHEFSLQWPATRDNYDDFLWVWGGYIFCFGRLPVWEMRLRWELGRPQILLYCHHFFWKCNENYHCCCFFCYW